MNSVLRSFVFLLVIDLTDVDAFDVIEQCAGIVDLHDQD
jgi:hypothetical protein